MTDLEKYDSMKPVLHKLIEFIYRSPPLRVDKVYENDPALNEFAAEFIKRMKCYDLLFRSMSERFFLGGRYYDRFRICTPEVSRNQIASIENKRYMKPTMRLLEKLVHYPEQFTIANYFIKNAIITMDMNVKVKEMWNSSLSYSFMKVLITYRNNIETYYWEFTYDHRNCFKPYLNTPDNLAAMDIIIKRLYKVIPDVETNLVDDPTVIAKYLREDQCRLDAVVLFSEILYFYYHYE